MACEANCVSKLTSVFSSVERDLLKRSLRAWRAGFVGVPRAPDSNQTAGSIEARRTLGLTALRELLQRGTRAHRRSGRRRPSDDKCAILRLRVFAARAGEHGSGHLSTRTHVRICFARKGKTVGELTLFFGGVGQDEP